MKTMRCIFGLLVAIAFLFYTGATAAAAHQDVMYAVYRTADHAVVQPVAACCGHVGLVNHLMLIAEPTILKTPDRTPCSEYVHVSQTTPQIKVVIVRNRGPTERLEALS